jgi:hypothetical protein
MDLEQVFFFDVTEEQKEVSLANALYPVWKVFGYLRTK